MAATIPSGSLPLQEKTPEEVRRPIKQAKMVGWYDPRQLMKTANEVLISTILGKHADRRLVQVVNPEKTQTYDYTKVFKVTSQQETAAAGEMVEREEIWVDYVSDLGDGFNPTYAIAFLLAQESLTIAGQTLPRGNILIMGGDQVYPTANSTEYTNRLEFPYGAALKFHEGERPHLFALPGNHDWYDSLASFTRIFFDRSYFPLFDEDEPQSDYQPGLWHVPQHRSYFALKLPHGYWLIGVDLQLSADLDVQQIDHFKAVAKQMKPGDQIILCTPEPYWVFDEMYGHTHTHYSETRLSRRYLEDKIFHAQKVVAYFAGDLHHYFRIHEKQTNAVRITAGGGGAFLHPTNGQMQTTYQNKSDCTFFSFPTAKECQRLCWRNFLFPFLNWRFGVMTATVYFLTAWSILAFLRIDASSDTYAEALSVTLQGALETPVGAFWALLILGGFLMFTDTHSRVYRVVAGLTHGSVHLVALFFIAWGAHFLTVGQGMVYKTPLQFLTSGALIFAGGWIVGSIIFGVYLFLSLNVFGRHSNEAFSSLAIQDYKNFLRLKIDANGLTIYPIGIRRVPRKWRAATKDDHTVSALVPDDPKATAPFLIETPIHVRRQ
ncbi:MAG TPA: hypothetical protein VFZ34_11185 [Blastocatellia bacterium]|nr:hypothetical protein [Blastocatellia bacterium]